MSSKGNRSGKSRVSAPATTPGAVSCSFEEMRAEEPGGLAPVYGTQAQESTKERRRGDEAAKAAGRRTARATVPGVTMMEEGPGPLGPSSSKKPKTAGSSTIRDRKAARGIAASVPGAVSVSKDEITESGETSFVAAAERGTKGRKQREPDLIDEKSTGRQHGKTRHKPATTPGAVRTQQTTVTTASYGMTKPARLTTGEVSVPGAVTVSVGEGSPVCNTEKGTCDRGSGRPGAQSISGDKEGEQDALVRRKDPRATARTKKLAASGGDSHNEEGADAYKARMEAKIKSMEDQLGGGSAHKNDVGKNDRGKTKSGAKGSLRGFDNDQPTMGLLPPQEPEAHYTTSTDRGVAGAPDLIYGSTNAGYGGAGYGGYGDISDEKLAIAIAIQEEEEQELFFPSAIEYDPDSKPPLRKNRRFQVYAGCGFALFLVLVVGIVLGLVVGPGLTSKTYAPTGSPTTSPSSSQEGIYSLQFLQVVGESAMIDGSPHNLAVRWITTEDPLKLSTDAPNLIQRYLLALFYFMTTNNGMSPWRTCNRPTQEEGEECMFDRLARDDLDAVYFESETATRWLSSAHECEWIGILCDDTQTLRAIELWGQNITGTLPVEIKEFTFLQSIALPYNELTGTIPEEWADMKHLLNLEVHGNFLTGTIPEAFMSSDGLQNLNVGENYLMGTMSSSIGLLTNLKGLHTFENSFSGSLPSEIGNLLYLAFTRNDGNQYNGTVPTEIAKLTLLEEMWLQENAFTGTIHSEIGQMTSLTDLRLASNKLTGSIPSSIYGLTLLTYLQLQQNQITGTISTMISKLKPLTIIRLSETFLTGTIPTEMRELTLLRMAHFHLNRMNGSMPVQVCDNVWNGVLDYLQTDCNPEEAPGVECECCTACCIRDSGVCTKTGLLEE